MRKQLELDAVLWSEIVDSGKFPTVVVADVEAATRKRDEEAARIRNFGRVERPAATSKKGASGPKAKKKKGASGGGTAEQPA